MSDKPTYNIFSGLRTALGSVKRDAKRGKHYSNIFAVSTVLIFLITFLATVSVELDPGRYVSSGVAIKNAMHADIAQDITARDEIWDWLDGVIERIGGETRKKIEVLCEYDTASQDVSIDGNVVGFFDPETPSHSCQMEKEFFTNEVADVSLAANNQLMSFGMFFERSIIQGTGKEVGVNRQSTTTMEEKIRDTQVTGDTRFIEIVRRGNDDLCVKDDALNSELGSTLKWNGTYIRGQRVFHKDSIAYLNFSPIRPCYTWSSDHSKIAPVNSSLTVQEIESLSSNMAFVSNEIDFYSVCYGLFNEPTALMAFEAVMAGVESISQVEAYQQCFTALNKSVEELYNAYEKVDTLFPISLTSAARGTFFACSSELKFVQDAHEELLRQRSYRTIDDNTRTLHIYAITRNIGVKSRFYTMTQISFQFDVSGKIRFDIHTDYSPIIQYTYGFSGYPVDDHLVMGLEIFFLCLFAIYCARECWQLQHRGRRVGALLARYYSRVNISWSVSNSPAARVVPSAAEEVRDQESSQVAIDDVESGEISAERNGECGNLTEDGEEDGKPKLVTDGGVEWILKSEANSAQSMTPSYYPRVLSTRSHKVEELRLTDWSPDETPLYDVLDWVTIWIVFMCLGYRLRFIALTSNFHEYMMDLNLEKFQIDQHLGDIISKFDVIHSTTLIYFNMVNIAIFVGLLQFFRYLSFDARLAIVTSTVYHSLSALLPVLLVFLTVLMCYAVVGMTLYGTALPEWATLSKSLNSLFFFVLGEVGAYNDMKDVQPALTAVFFWTFIVVILFILFNMVLAVIMAVYDEKVGELRERIEKNKKHI